MKKLLLTISFLLAFIASFAAHVPPVRTMSISPALSTAMNIDGVDDEPYWSAEQSTEAFNPTGSTGADADYTFTYKVCVDQQYLYVYGKIQDDYENSWEWGESSQWTYDCVELFIDLDTNGSGANPDYDSNTYQLRINRGIDSIGDDCGRPGKSFRKQHKYYWENTADGWIFEAALAWKFVLGDGQKTEDILQYADGIVASGFDMIGIDSDADGPDSHSCQTAWDMDGSDDAADRTEDNAWNDRTVFGIVTLQWTWFNIKPNLVNNSTQIYPNPVGDFLNIDNTTCFKNAKIFNMIGQQLLDIQCKSGDNNLNVSDLPGGCIYFLRLTDSDNEIYTAKFVKE